MSLFIDTNVFYAHHDEDAPRHRIATDAFETITTGEYGRLFTSEYVYDETVTLVRQRTGRIEPAIRVGERIRGVEPFPRVFDLLYVTEPVFSRTVDTFERYDDQSLSFTDATIVTLVDHYDIDAVLSFDDDFDGVVDRIDPAII
ncbi:type II toxin-antitoxin system VapC family toxin [Natronobiforma cellulositropha]|uniref:type II toxin-antitoxin system VapC family toxin n=1 Tax=Natronobiforma cellulositropha TaxID=1679076 RepID=UPI0021D60A4F|nr:PIN domain-containing protein [Natronobiforma cellulositropha]